MIRYRYVCVDTIYLSIPKAHKFPICAACMPYSPNGCLSGENAAKCRELITCGADAHPCIWANFIQFWFLFHVVFDFFCALFEMLYATSEQLPREPQTTIVNSSHVGCCPCLSLERGHVSPFCQESAAAMHRNVWGPLVVGIEVVRTHDLRELRKAGEGLVNLLIVTSPKYWWDIYIYIYWEREIYIYIYYNHNIIYDICIYYIWHV